MKKKFFKSLLRLLAVTIITQTIIADNLTASAAYSIVPANPSDRQFTMEITPGQEKQASVIVENLSDQPVTLRLYGADATLSNQGSFALTTLTTPQRHLGQWIIFQEDILRLEGRQHKEIGFTVKVPENATPGTYGGGIAAETGGTVPAAAGDTENTGKQSGSISISSRIVVKIFVSIPGNKIHKYEWTGFSYVNPSKNGSKDPSANNTKTTDEGTFNLAYGNAGNTIVIIDQDIQISGFPMQNTSIKLPSATLLQGSKLEIPAKWKDEPFFGFYTAKAIISFSEYDIIRNTKINTITEIREIPVYIPLKTETTAGKIVLTLLAVIACLLSILIISLINSWVFRKKCTPYVVQDGDTITSIADSCKVSWKKLVKLNKLKAPYTLKPGQKISAPAPKTKPTSKSS